MSLVVDDRPLVSASVAAPLLPVVGADLEVPVLGGDTQRYTNLDYAATAPALERVAAAVADALPLYASVHRGAGLPSQVSTARYEQARARVSAFVDARADDVCVFTRNTTDALNLLASCVPGDVVCLDAEHHANLLPWGESARVIAVQPTLAATLARLDFELAAAPAALLAITGASNVTGELLPIDEIVALAHARGARVVIDAAQLAPHRRFSLARSGADYVAFSGHKLYAPFGVGALTGRSDWLDAAPPFLAGGGAVRDVRADGVDWCSGPQRHEAGTPNLLGALALAEAADALSSLAPDALSEHEAALRGQLLDGLAELPDVTVHRIWEDSTDAIGVVCFSVAGRAAGHVAAALSAEHAIGVRDGRFCAHRLLTRLGLSGGAVRASFGVGSTSADVDRLLAALAAGPRAPYVERDGAWTPVFDDRTFGDLPLSPTRGC